MQIASFFFFKGFCASQYIFCNIIASGGVRDLSHIQKCKDLGLYGVIAGKAIYEKTLDLKEAISIC